MKIKNLDANYTRDLARCADYLAIVDCPGGRPIVKGYICPHCGADPSHGDCDGVHPLNIMTSLAELDEIRGGKVFTHWRRLAAPFPLTQNQTKP